MSAVMQKAPIVFRCMISDNAAAAAAFSLTALVGGSAIAAGNGWADYQEGGTLTFTGSNSAQAGANKANTAITLPRTYSLLETQIFGNALSCGTAPSVKAMIASILTVIPAATILAPANNTVVAATVNWTILNCFFANIDNSATAVALIAGATDLTLFNLAVYRTGFAAG